MKFVEGKRYFTKKLKYVRILVLYLLTLCLRYSYLRVKLASTEEMFLEITAMFLQMEKVALKEKKTFTGKGRIWTWGKTNH